MGRGHGQADFVGKVALHRMSALPPERRLVGMRFGDGADPVAELRGVPLTADERIVGRVTSAEHSPAVGGGIGLGWIRALEGEFPTQLRANGRAATVVPTPFYDPAGARLRG